MGGAVTGGAGQATVQGMKRKRLIATALPAMLFATTAYAVRQPDYLAERPLETAGAPAVMSRNATALAPSKAKAAMRAFIAAHGSWTATWDADTGVPTWLGGEGIKAAGAMADDAIAADAATALLAEQIGLLAPGAAPSDFVIAANVVKGGLRTVAFRQTARGLDVWGGHVLMLFKHDRLFAIANTSSPDVGVTAPTTIADGTAKAIDWIVKAYGGDPEVLATGAPVVLPIVHAKGDLEHRVVVPVTVDLAEPRAQWTVFVDAATGEPIARHQRLQFATGAIKYHVSDRYPGGTHSDYPATFANHKLDGTTTVTSDGDGNFSWATATDATVTPGLTGTKVRITVGQGTVPTASLTVSPTTGAIWDLSTVERDDAALTSFIHANLAKAYAKANLDPDLPWLDAQMRVTVNEDDVCNAYSNLDDIHFFVKGSQGNITCENTGRMADVVYHETGHSIHCQAMQDRLGIDCEQSFDSSLSEGVSDYLAATITNDPAMGIGFMGPGPLRHIDPDGHEARYPENANTGDPHEDGLIIAGALWDLRKALVVELGEAEGVALADDIYYGIISTGVDMTSTYMAALAVDDDDGDLANGTPHQCTITDAFRLHGLSELPGSIGGPGRPEVDGLDVRIAQPDGGASECPPPAVTGATITWRLLADRNVGGTVDLDVGATEVTGSIPEPDTAGVVEYQVNVTTADGMSKRYPLNLADGWYQAYVGPVTTLYCNDFESTSDWTLGGDFEVGAPAVEAGAYDAPSAFSGDNVLAQNLEGNYRDDSTSSASSPVIDTTGFTTVHVQYRRWLDAEDAEYDHATISADGDEVWRNLRTTDGDVMHLDGEWRFHDVDVSAAAADGSVQISFGMEADQGLNFGGWTVDDFCVVGIPAGGLSCGDGTLDDTEQCDDGNAVDGDGCSASCLDESVDGGCCSTSGDGAVAPLALGLMTFAGLGLRRRRRRA